MFFASGVYYFTRARIKELFLAAAEQDKKDTLERTDLSSLPDVSLSDFRRIFESRSMKNLKVLQGSMVVGMLFMAFILLSAGRLPGSDENPKDYVNTVTIMTMINFLWPFRSLGSDFSVRLDNAATHKIPILAL